MTSGFPLYLVRLLYSVFCTIFCVSFILYFLGPTDLSPPTPPPMHIFFSYIRPILFSCLESLVIQREACISTSEHPTWPWICRLQLCCSQSRLPDGSFWLRVWHGAGDRWCTCLGRPVLGKNICEKERSLLKREAEVWTWWKARPLPNSVLSILSWAPVSVFKGPQRWTVFEDSSGVTWGALPPAAPRLLRGLGKTTSLLCAVVCSS